MTVYRNSNLLSKIHSSYLWTSDPVQTNNADFKNPSKTFNDYQPIEELDPISSETGIRRSKTLITKEPTTISLTEMKVRQGNREAWTPMIDSEQPLIDNRSSSRLTLLTKSGRQICQCRIFHLVLACLLLLAILAVITIPIGIVLGVLNKITTSTGTTRTTTTSTTGTSSTSTTSTTTTDPASAWIPTNFNVLCPISCVNVSTVTPSTLIASWTFEQNTNDVSGNGYHGQILNGGTFVNGYIGQSIHLDNTLSQFVNAPWIPLNSRSFTLEGWIYLDSLSPSSDLDIFSQTESSNFSRRLHYVVRQNKLYMGFFSNDLIGTTTLTNSLWYHIAFVYDSSSNIKWIYLNGIQDASSTSSGSTPSLGPYLGVDGNTSIGAMTNVPTSSYWNGRLDQISLSNRVKTSCEILNDASLLAHFPFDSSLTDIGPNSLPGVINTQNNAGLSWVSGRLNNALRFNASVSYFQTCGLWALGQNVPFSIGMWVNPSFPGGTLFHLSSSATGAGAWCLPMIGFSSNGSIAVQMWRGFTVPIVGPILPIGNWTHLIVTWSSTNGLRLYINGGLFNSVVAPTFSASGLVMCALLANSGLGGNCNAGAIQMGPFLGVIDEFHLFTRELNSFEVCSLAHP